ncbi:MAG TPA: hypothetical protein VH416_09130 [Gaiellaceae bacterium]
MTIAITMMIHSLVFISAFGYPVGRVVVLVMRLPMFSAAQIGYFVTR